MPANVARQIIQEDLVGRVVREPLYDTETMANATFVELTFFSRPQGQNMNSGLAKTNVHTNLTQANQLGNPNSFLLMGFQVSMIDAFVTATGAELLPEDVAGMDRDLRSRGTLEFGLSGKTLFEIPLSEVPQGLGLTGAWEQDVAADAYIHSYGIPMPNNYYNARIPQRILTKVFKASSPMIAGYVFVNSSTPITCKIRFGAGGYVAAAANTTVIQVRLIGVRLKAIG